MNRAPAIALVAALIPMAGCQTDPPTKVDDDVPPVEQVTLLAPADGLVVPQNDPTIGCPAHPHAGFGFELRLDWADVEGADGYDLLVQNRTARYPMIDQTVDVSEHVFLACNGFVIDRNLQGWEWKVRVRGTDGSVGPWSVREFSFEPCRLDDGTPCNAPPP